MVKEKFLISKIYGAYYEIYSPTLGKKRAVLRGKFRLENSKERHPFVVGDKILAIPSSGDEWVIDKLEERKNFLIRKSGLNDSHVLCSNVDQVAIFASLKDPETKEGFIDRALIASGKAGIPATIVFTKSDLVSENDYKKILSIYKNSGIDTMAVSVFNISSLENFRKVLEGKVTFLVGNSGVGKSTILNKFLDNNFQITAEISSSTGKGRHTTTNSNLVP
ncbi:MAG: ribosome small subunit-dependent GTPase A, partial [Leptospiraceae bacterium]|nr:ribosome small subunit-dependent GTPase A [Leptospiraceae bacterium]